MVLQGEGPRWGLCINQARQALSAFAKSHPGLQTPIDIESIAGWMGFQVVQLYSVGEAFSGLVSLPQKLIGVNGRHHRHRRRFTIGHELAHILLKHPPESRCSPKEIDLYNAEADACAAELLIPTRMLTEQMRATKDVASLAACFDVSDEALRVKLRTIGQVREANP